MALAVIDDVVGMGGVGRLAEGKNLRQTIGAVGIGILENSFAQPPFDLVVKRIAPLRQAIISGAVKVGLIGQVLGDEQHVGLDRFQFLGQPQEKTVIHIRAMRRVETKAIDVILANKQFAGI